MASTSTSDNLTAAAIRQALGAAAAGRLGDACAIGERALQQGGEAAALHAMLGMLRSRSGDFGRAADHLSAARTARPDDLVIATNLAMALGQLGRHREALDIVNEDFARADKTLQLSKVRGFLAQMSNEFEIAANSYEHVVSAQPSDWESWNNLGNARRAAGDFDGSVEALRRAAEINPASAPVRLNFGAALVSAGQFEEAELQLRKMAEDFPADAKPLRDLHALFKLQARDDEALEAIEGAVVREPDDVELWLALASHRLSLLRHSAAEEAYREVVARDPANSLGNLGLAVTFELTNRTEELTALVDEARHRKVADDAMNFIRAFHYRRAKRFEDGLDALSKVPDELETARRAHLLGQLEEGAGNYDRAFASFERMNEIQRADPSQPEERAAAYRTRIAQQLDTLTPEWVSSWREGPIDRRPTPVFLVGFPRSGTTLLDTILMGHPGVEVLEEEPALRRANQLIPDFAALAGASDEIIGQARDTYFEIAAALTPLRPGNLLVDKNPLAMNGIPLIRRIFPRARIILALRHPCDVVLSCFATNFKLNDGMANFLRLDTAAELYDLSFRYFERARALLAPPVHTIVYENIVEDRDRELRPLFDFLGLEWHDDVLDHESTARSRGHIKTASYAQVTEPIYTRSAGRWQNYRKHLDPILPVLRPWVEKFGYEF
jgi:tetratricopeptide (TPR) repeat protein